MADHIAAGSRARDETPEQKYLRQIRDSVYFIAVVVFLLVVFLLVVFGIMYGVVLAVRAAAGS